MFRRRQALARLRQSDSDRDIAPSARLMRMPPYRWCSRWREPHTCEALGEGRRDHQRQRHEFCGARELVQLRMEDVEHRATRVRGPRTHCFVERMNRTP